MFVDISQSAGVVAVVRAWRLAAAVCGDTVAVPESLLAARRLPRPPLPPLLETLPPTTRPLHYRTGRRHGNRGVGQCVIYLEMLCDGECVLLVIYVCCHAHLLYCIKYKVNFKMNCLERRCKEEYCVKPHLPVLNAAA